MKKKKQKKKKTRFSEILKFFDEKKKKKKKHFKISNFNILMKICIMMFSPLKFKHKQWFIIRQTKCGTLLSFFGKRGNSDNIDRGQIIT